MDTVVRTGALLNTLENVLRIEVVLSPGVDRHMGSRKELLDVSKVVGASTFSEDGRPFSALDGVFVHQYRNDNFVMEPTQLISTNLLTFVLGSSTRIQAYCTAEELNSPTISSRPSSVCRDVV